MKTKARLFSLIIFGILLISTLPMPVHAATTTILRIGTKQLNLLMVGYPVPSDMTHPKYSMMPGQLVSGFQITDGGVTHDAFLATAPRIVNGKLVFHIASYTWNNAPVPAEEYQEFVDTMPSLNQYLDQSLTAVLGPTYKIQKLTISTGIMTLVATV